MASGPRHGTCSPVSDSLSLRLRDFDPLASPHTATRRFILQKTRRNARAPRHLEGPRFQVLFHSPRRGSFHLSLTVLCAIGGRPYSALDRGRPGFGQGSSCPALLRNRASETDRLRVRGCHPLRRSCPAPSAAVPFSRKLAGSSPRGPATPLMRFGLLPVRSPLLGESLLISFPALLRWFTSRSVASAPYFIQAFGWRNRFRRVAPFGNPGIKGRSLLPLDFRGLPRPSSPDGPKASASGLLSLGHIAPSARSKLALPRKAFFLRFLFVFPSLVVSKNTRRVRRRLLETRGFEPLTSGLQSRRSSQLSHAPEKSLFGKSGKKEEDGVLGRRLQLYTSCLPLSKKGGDPAAPSGTTTLLRLHPPHEASLRHGPPCGRARGFGRAPLGWCDGRCVQGPGTYSPRRADARLLAIPTSRSRVSDSDPD